MFAVANEEDRGDRFLIPLLIKDNGYRYYDIK